MGASLIAAVLGMFTAAAIENSSSWYKDTETKQRSKCSNWLHNHKTGLKAIAAWAFWSSFGTIGYCLLEDKFFIEGLYFSVSAASTGGLAGVAPKNGNLWFCGIYSLIAVPLYGHTLGMLANIFTASALRQQAKKRREAPITQEEFVAIDNLNPNKSLAAGDQQIDREEFTILWMLRNGLLSPENIQEIEEDFKTLDADRSGSIRLAEIQASIGFKKYDGLDGDLNANELFELTSELQKTECMDNPDKMLLDPRKNYTISSVARSMTDFSGRSTAIDIKSEQGKNNRVAIVPDGPSGPLNFNVEFTLKDFMLWWWSEAGAYLSGKADEGVIKKSFVRHLERMVNQAKKEEEKGRASMVEPAALKQYTRLSVVPALISTKSKSRIT